MRHPTVAWVVERSDVVSTDPVIIVERSVQWYRPDGTLIGSVRVPSLDETAIDQPPGLSLTPSGVVVALLAFETVVEVRVLSPEP